MRCVFGGAVVALASVGGLMAACQSSSSSSAPSEGASEPSSDAASAQVGLPIVGTWIAQTIDGVKVTEMMASTLRAPSLTILGDGSVNGFSGVNTFHSTMSQADLQNGVFEPGPMAMTMMAGPPDAMRVEGRFMTDLDAATGFEVQGNTLHLTEGGMTLITFARGS